MSGAWVQKNSDEWIVEHDDAESITWTSVDCEYGVVALIAREGWTSSPHFERVTNLVVAAPELLEALAAVVVTYKRDNPMRTADIHDPGCTCMRCAIDFADAAIAKATVGAA